MAIKDYDDLNEIQLDVLKEIGNIGAGNAATSLADMLMTPIDISVPVVRILDYEEATERLGGPETMIVGLMIQLEGDFQGMIMFLLEKEFAIHTLNTLMGTEINSFTELDEVALSAFKELANIMAASYVNAIASMTGMRIDLTVPDLCIDMLGAILSVPAIHYANISDKIILIEGEFNGEDSKSTNHVLLLPDVESLDKIMSVLGIEL